MNKGVLLFLALVCGLPGCGGGTGGSKGGVGGAAGVIDGASGGVAVGGSATESTGGNPGTGAIGVGDAGTDAAGTGAAASSGAGGMGAAASGGIGSGGLATAGSAGTEAPGGAGTGGARTGGAGTGSARTGGTGSGGAQTGGVGTGGNASGGTGGTPAGASLELDRSRMDFDRVALGTTSVQTFTLTNRGASTSGVPIVRTETDRYPEGTPDPVTVTGCDAALLPNASCTLTLSVTPPKLGLFEAWVRITADPGAEEHDLSLFVVGWAIGFEVSSPSAIDLGDLAPGVPVRHSITVTALIALSDLTVRTSGEDVSIDASSSTCTATLAQGASCVVTVEFAAPAVGWKRDIVNIKAGGDMGQIAVIEMTANVSSASDLAIEPGSPPSYACVFEETSPPVVFTVTNVGNNTSGTIASAIVGEDAQNFAIADTDCTVLAPQATCTVSVVCSPPMSASAAERHAILSVTDGDTHLSVPLSGEVSFEM